MSESQGGSDKEITITIRTPKGKWENAIFQKTAKISEVVNAIKSKFGFSNEGKYQLNREDEPDNPLDPERPLVSFGIKDGDTLVFTDLGVAVHDSH